MKSSVFLLNRFDSNSQQGLLFELRVLQALKCSAQAIRVSFTDVFDSVDSQKVAVSEKIKAARSQKEEGAFLQAFAPLLVSVGHVYQAPLASFFSSVVNANSIRWVLTHLPAIETESTRIKGENLEWVSVFAMQAEVFICTYSEAEVFFNKKLESKKSIIKTALSFIHAGANAILIRQESPKKKILESGFSDVFCFRSKGNVRVKVFSVVSDAADAVRRNRDLFSAACLAAYANGETLADSIDFSFAISDTAAKCFLRQELNFDAFIHAQIFLDELAKTSFSASKRQAKATFENDNLVKESPKQSLNSEQEPVGENQIQDEKWMRECIYLAEKAANAGEVPVGALVVHGEKEVGSAFNLREKSHDPTAHAELIALRRASEKLRRWRLNDCTLYVTLEPCIMCAGALINARIGRLVFGARDEKAGAVGSLHNLCCDARLNHIVEVKEGVLAHECKAELQSFFKSLREKKRT